jgi:hypothetical protein
MHHKFPMTACALMMAWTSAASAGDMFCNGASTSQFTMSIFSKLESSHDPRFVRAIYDAEFADRFKSTFGFDSFYSSLTGVHNRLAIGPRTGRNLESRTLSGPEVVGAYSPSQSVRPPLQHVQAQTTRPGDVVDIEFFTSSGVGKIRQRMQLECQGGRWRVNGIWYFPSGAK